MSVVTKGCIAQSLNGRDKGKYFFVLSCDEGFAYIVDGKQRRLEAPKRKNRKHIRPTSLEDGKITAKIIGGEYITNSEIRKSLARIYEANESEQETKE
jgi:ribosomal protein L14E/L6E/L27E